MEFHEKRRQHFLNEQAYNKELKYFQKRTLPSFLTALNAKNQDASDRSRISSAIADEKFSNYLLRYTAGESLAILQEDLTEVVGAFECAAKYEREFKKSPEFPFFGFQEIDDFQRIIQLVSLAILLHRVELIAHIHSLIANSVYDGKDAMYEEMISHHIADRPYLDIWYHQFPYLHLLNATDDDSHDAKVFQVKEYLNSWYESMQEAIWHDSHLDVTNEVSGNYFGYWAIEAAAIAYLYKIDDSSFRDYIHYPKDLVDFAKNLDERIDPDLTASGLPVKRKIAP